MTNPLTVHRDGCDAAHLWQEHRSTIWEDMAARDLLADGVAGECYRSGLLGISHLTVPNRCIGQ
jgi:hypothetical protein